VPFDRMVSTVDRWAGETGAMDIFAQVGPGGAVPQHIQWSAMLTPAEFRCRIAEANVIISHAGMGTILTVLEAKKPLLIMPRLARLGEQRNDHQLATARSLQEQTGLSIAQDELELRAWLDRLDEVRVPERGSSGTRAQLIETLRDFILS